MISGYLELAAFSKALLSGQSGPIDVELVDDEGLSRVGRHELVSRICSLQNKRFRSLNQRKKNCLVFTKIRGSICRCPRGSEPETLTNGVQARSTFQELVMPRLKELDEYELSDELVAEFAEGYEARRAELRAQKAAAKQPKKALQNYRNEFVAKRKLYTPPVEFALELKNGKSPDKRREWLRGFAVACRVLGLHDQSDLFANHVDPGEAQAVAEAAV